MTLGAVLGGKYRLEGLLGQGGMGSVWRARNLKLDAPVAVKLMDPSIVADPNALMRFHREAHAGAAVRSPHVLQVFDHDVDARTGHPYIVMELLEGESSTATPARAPSVPSPSSSWGPGTRQMLLGYGLTALLMFGSFGYSAWMQTRTEERVARLSTPAHVESRAATPPPEHPSELAATVRRMAHWLPGLLIPLGVMGVSVWRFIVRKRQSADV